MSMIHTPAQRGFTLTELMISLVLGSLVVLAATAMVSASRGTYRTQDETTRIAESARTGLELSNRMVRLAGYTNFGDDTTPPASYIIDSTWTASPDAYAFNGPNIVGANASVPGGGTVINSSDALTIRYFGSSPPNAATADGNVLDCAGFPVPKAITQATPAVADVTNQSRAYNVLFVANDPDGEPSLKCQRQTYDAVTGEPSATASDTQTLIRGVESFHVLFGELMPQASPNDDLDLNLPGSLVYRTGIGGGNPVTNWANVRSVRIGMLLRSAIGTRPDPDPTTTVYRLFGATYPTADPGANFALTSMSVAERTRVRRVITTTVFIRNRMNDWQSVQAN